MSRQTMREAAARYRRAELVEQLPAHVLELARHELDVERLANEGPRSGDDDLVRRAASARLTTEYGLVVTQDDGRGR